MSIENEIQHSLQTTRALQKELRELDTNLQQAVAAIPALQQELGQAVETIAAFNDFYKGWRSNSTLKVLVVDILANPDLLKKKQKEFSKLSDDEKKEIRLHSFLENHLKRIAKLLAVLKPHYQKLSIAMQNAHFQELHAGLEQELTILSCKLREMLHAEHVTRTYLGEVWNTLITKRAKLTSIDWAQINTTLREIKENLHALSNLSAELENLAAFCLQEFMLDKQHLHNIAVFKSLLEHLFFSDRNILKLDTLFLTFIYDRNNKDPHYTNFCAYIKKEAQEEYAGFQINEREFYNLVTLFNAYIQKYKVKKSLQFIDLDFPYAFNGLGHLVHTGRNQAIPISQLDKETLLAPNHYMLIALTEVLARIREHNNIIPISPAILAIYVGRVCESAFGTKAEPISETLFKRKVKEACSYTRFGELYPLELFNRVMAVNQDLGTDIGRYFTGMLLMRYRALLGPEWLPTNY